MDEILARGVAARPRRMSAVTAAEVGANVSLQDGEVTEVVDGQPPRETHIGPERIGAAGGRMERSNSAPQVVHQRHMPKEPNKFHIPRKTRENRALFQYVSTESREFEDMMTILTSTYIDTGSAGCFTYSKPRLVHSEPLEKEFVEKRKEMKADGRTDKELEESYGFLLADTSKLPMLCEKGLCVGQSWITVLGNPCKGVYLSRYSDLLQVNPLTPGATGEIIIFKVMKGKVKSIYENMKNILDPTPRFDSHISKNASKVTSLNSYRAFELTQQYFYEYTFDELRQRPRQVCPCAVISFHFKGKDSPLPSKPLAPIRLNSQSAEGSKERAQFTVWTGDLVKGDQVLFQISLRSYSPPLLPHRLPEKLKVDCLMRLDQVTKLVPAGLFSFNLYNSSQEVVKSGHYCSLLEVVDKSRSTTSITKLLQELEIKRVVLVTPLTERGFLFLLSSVQMATPAERGENWKRCLQALFVFPEHRDVAKSTSRCASSPRDASQPFTSGATVMPRLNQFIPALHHALVKARANPPPELSAGVERQAREYLIGLTDGKEVAVIETERQREGEADRQVRQYPMGEYDSKLDERGKLFPAPKHHRVNMDGYLRSYLYNPALYLLSVARARQMVEVHCGPEESQEAKVRKSFGGQKESTGKEVTGNTRDGQSNTQKMQQLIDLVLTCKRNAENEVKREEGGDAGLTAPGRKRRREQETAERALKFLKASQEHGSHDKIPGLNQAASGMASQSLCEAPEEEQRESCPFDKLATRLGLPTNCDIDLRKQEELEEQMAGLCSERYTQRDRNIPQDPRFQHLTTASSITTPTKSPRKSPTLSPEPSPPTSPFQCLSPEPSPPLSPSQCPSPDPSPPLSPSQCPSPEPSPPLSPSQCPSPVPSPPPSPSQCPSPQPSPPSTPLYCPSPQPSPPPSPSRCQSLEPNERNPLNKSNSGANEERLASTASREFAGMSKDRQEKPQGKEKKNEEPSIFASIQPSIPPAPERRTNSSPPPSEQGKEDAVLLEKETVQKMQKQREEEATERKQDEEEVVDMICEDYISSLQDSINSMLTEFSNSWPSHSADTRRTDDADATLANKPSQGSAVSLSPRQSLHTPLSRSPARPLASIPAPPATALSSLISQLQPEVFNSLVEIIKDVRKNSLQFYLHSTEPGDQVYEDVKEHLLKQGNVEQSPVDFLNQESSDNRLLVVIKNKDIAGHIHKIPNLVSVKRHPSVVFVGIDTLDDIRNNSYNELFVSGGCIVSDELVLNPDFITHGRLAALLMFLEQHSSLESVWRWKIHCKTHKKLKEQARFRRDAASILDLLSVYQKRQIVEFLPYHHCDMMNHQSPNLDCLIELQARYTQYRHTVFLTEHRLEKFAAYSSCGIIVAGIDEILHSFTRLVGYHDIKDKQPIMDDLLAAKGLDRQLSHGDSVSGSERSPSIFPEHTHPLSSGDQPQHLLQQPSSGLLPLPHLSDQLVPDASCKDGVPQPSDTDFEVLRLAISHLRAERQAQLQQQRFDSQSEFSINPLKSFLPNPSHNTPPAGQGGPTESARLTLGRKAVATTLDLIHSALQPELGEEGRKEDRVEAPTEGQRRGRSLGGGEPGDGCPAVGLVGGNQGPSNNDTSIPLSSQSTTRPNDQTDSTDVRREKVEQQKDSVFLKAAQQGAASFSTSSCPVEGDRSRDAQPGQEQPIRREGALLGNRTAGGTKVTESVTMVTGQENNPNPAPLRLPQQHLQQQQHQQQQRISSGALASFIAPTCPNSLARLSPWVPC
ncbi:LOW QUALITY PROTEIN: protein TASOR [Lates calcarifer]|uniref:LOW QUALITY PROTEIN: protein TASOR n=1 Tax=Lates calcarifer TaxID=8187 RepID=A0AAJ8BER8_LATCA|nr:LOW QUALITY PROTEIN: protein TASOR [Lates calcarifer]